MNSPAFCFLSPMAQELIVMAVLGKFENGPPPNIPESVQKEISEWAETEE